MAFDIASHALTCFRLSKSHQESREWWTERESNPRCPLHEWRHAVNAPTATHRAYTDVQSPAHYSRLSFFKEGGLARSLHTHRLVQLAALHWS